MDNQPSEAALKVSRQFLAWQHGPLPVTTIDIDTLARAFDAYAAERERAARTAALEQATGAVCSRCKQGVKTELLRGVCMHWVKDGLHAKGTEGRWGTCAASAIRALMSETEVTP